MDSNADLVASLPPVEGVRFVAGDACEVASLQAAHFDEMDVVVAATGDDEDNLVISLLAKQEFAVPRVIARVNHPKNHWLFNEMWGVDVAVSTPQLLAGLVEEAVSVGMLVRLLQFDGGNTRLMEVTLEAGSPAVKSEVGTIGLPRGAAVVALVREGHVVVPRSDTILGRGRRSAAARRVHSARDDGMPGPCSYRARDRLSGRAAPGEPGRPMPGPKRLARAKGGPETPETRPRRAGATAARPKPPLIRTRAGSKGDDDAGRTPSRSGPRSLSRRGKRGARGGAGKRQRGWRPSSDAHRECPGAGLIHRAARTAPAAGRLLRP